MAVSIALLGWSIYLFVEACFKFFGIALPKVQSFALSVLLYNVLISQLPSVYEFFYWYAGTTAYLYSIIFFLLFLAIISKLEKGKKFVWLSALLVVLVNGNNEMLIPFTNLFLLVILMWQVIYKGKLRIQSFILNLVSWISSFAAIFAPGNISRQLHYAEGGEFFDSLQAAVLSTGMFLIKSLIEFPYVLFYAGIFLLVFYSSKKAQNQVNHFFSPVIFSLLSFLCLVSVNFVPLYATGYLRVNDGRIGNMVHIVTLIILFINVINTSLYVKRKAVDKIYVSGSWIVVVFGAFLIGVVLLNPNYKNLRADFEERDLTRFKRETEKREAFLKSSDNAELVLDRIHGTAIMDWEDITKKPRHWINECYMQMINKKNNKNIKLIKIE
ncbi:DUF6056 family protein [Salinimicrobium sp. 3283s]|uniref:DUF6056 family protein n=1 Tax=Salinimicrobium sp. 3283s TaxID=3114359 RepID=UPI0031E86379